MLGSPILYLKGMRAIMFQLSGFYYKPKIYGAPATKHDESRFFTRSPKLIFD